jgi:hypothetical protein
MTTLAEIVREEFERIKSACPYCDGKGECGCVETYLIARSSLRRIVEACADEVDTAYEAGDSFSQTARDIRSALAVLEEKP